MLISTLSNLVGGLGLLIMGMSMMTEGLKLASGNALRDILAIWTNSRLRALFSGLLITGVVQSSSAVTVATIGFANAEMLTLEQAVWVIYGSNVGTTMTGWIVALVGFKVNIEALSLPLIGLGALLKFTSKHTRTSSIGMAMVGFGLLFLGINFLKDAFINVGDSATLPGFQGPFLLQTLVYLGFGVLLTTLMQSSSAAMVVTLSAAQSGLIPLDAAAALVIGANLGTTSTALLSVVGATPTAKRVAVSHVAFNLVTALVAIFILSPMLQFGLFMENSLGLVSTPALSLAIFHTIFNILGVLLMWPLSSLLVTMVQKLFTTRVEAEAKPRYLDKNVLALPFIATDAIALEVSRINQFTITALRQSLQFSQVLPQSFQTHRIVHTLADEIARYAALVNRTELTPFLTDTLAGLMESTQQYLLVIDIAEEIALLNTSARLTLNHEEATALEAYLTSINLHLDAQDLGQPERVTPGTASYENVEQTYHKLKQVILLGVASGRFDMQKVDQFLQYVNQAKRACRQILKATQRLLLIRDTLHRDTGGYVFSSDGTARQEVAGSAEQDSLVTVDNKPGPEPS